MAPSCWKIGGRDATFGTGLHLVLFFFAKKNRNGVIRRRKIFGKSSTNMLAAVKSADHLRIGRGVRGTKANREARTIVRSIVAVTSIVEVVSIVPKRRGADEVATLLVGLKSKLKRDLQTRVTTPSIGEHLFPFL